MTLSVVIPNYNHAKYLPECIEAVLSQTRLPDEILIVDDCSTDNSVEIIKDYARKEKRIRLISNEKNSGPSFSVNTGAKNAKGKYFAICAADDYHLPRFLETMMRLAESYPNAALLCSGYYDFLDGTKPYNLKNQTFFTGKKVSYFEPKDLVEFLWKTSFIIPSMAAMYKRDVFLKYQFNEDMKSLSDFYLNYQIAFRNPIVYLEEPLGAYRIIKNSYGDSFRRAFFKRSRIYTNWLNKVTKEEDPLFQKRFHDSGLMHYGGKFLFLYLLFRPKFWYLYSHLRNKKKAVQNVSFSSVGENSK